MEPGKEEKACTMGECLDHETQEDSIERNEIRKVNIASRKQPSVRKQWIQTLKSLHNNRTK